MTDANKLWQGRFNASTAEILEEFNASITFDYLMYEEDIAGSIAHSRMLAKQKIITGAEQQQIEDGLKQIEAEIAQDPRSWAYARIADEDIHMAVEKRLTEIIGAVAKKLHTARSRNDQVATDLRLWLKNQADVLSGFLKNLLTNLKKRAELDIDVIMPGYTHLQQAQPISLAHFWLAYFDKFQRDLERLQDSLKRIDVMPLGSGALAGTGFNLDRDYTAKLLNFAKVSTNSLDAVADRDFVLEYEFSLSMIMLHLSQLAEEMIVWNSQEFSFIRISDAYATGSSMMPQKKNPDIPELLRGKAGRVIGVLNALMITIKGLPLAYNKDLQEDKEQLFMAHETTCKCLKIASEFLLQIEINQKRMRLAVENSFASATDLADYLVRKGLAFREAYTVVGHIVSAASQQQKYIHDLSLSELQSFSEKIKEDVFNLLTPEALVDARTVYGGTARSCIQARLSQLEI
jgi:argininosuccinate lyase